MVNVLTMALTADSQAAVEVSHHSQPAVEAGHHSQPPVGASHRSPPGAEARNRHAHGHGGSGPRTGEEQPGVLPPAAASASVAIDIGPGRGALVLYPSERFRDREIEISPVGGHGRRVHTGVHQRTTESQSLLTAIFGSLPAGQYVVWEDTTTEGPVITVADGAVAEVRLI